jgi:hypothetical protein
MRFTAVPLGVYTRWKIELAVAFGVCTPKSHIEIWLF